MKLLEHLVFPPTCSHLDVSCMALVATDLSTWHVSSCTRCRKPRPRAFKGFSPSLGRSQPASARLKDTARAVRQITDLAEGRKEGARARWEANLVESSRAVLNHQCNAGAFC